MKSLCLPPVSRNVMLHTGRGVISVAVEERYDYSCDHGREYDSCDLVGEVQFM